MCYGCSRRRCAFAEVDVRCWRDLGGCGGADGPARAGSSDGDSRVAGVGGLAGRLRASLAGISRVQTDMKRSSYGATAQAGSIANKRSVGVIEDEQEEI